MPLANRSLITIIDDGPEWSHPSRGYLVTLFSEFTCDFERPIGIVYDSTDPDALDDAAAPLRSNRPDLLVLDLHLDDSAFDTTWQLYDFARNIGVSKIVAFTAVADVEVLEEVSKRKFDAIVAKNHRDELVDVAYQLLDGLPVDGDLPLIYADADETGHRILWSQTLLEIATMLEVAGLTEKEQRCLLALRDHLTTREIASAVGFSSKTSSKHLHGAIRRLMEMDPPPPEWPADLDLADLPDVLRKVHRWITKTLAKPGPHTHQ